MYDVIIAGGGIAGLSSALILGRCRRSVLVCDTGKPRNAASTALHGFVTRDGTNPMEMRRLARKDLDQYSSVICRKIEVLDAEPIDQGYLVRLADGTTETASFLLVATGIVDRLPKVEGLAQLYGTSVFHCPYCDGWEMRDQAVAIYGDRISGYEFALELAGWTSDIVLCLDGSESLTQHEHAVLDRNGIRVREEPIVRLEGSEGKLQRILFRKGPDLPRTALFFTPDQYQASPLAKKLGCTITGGTVETARFQSAGSRLFVAGDAARSVQLAIVAAAEGAEAAFAINSALLKEKLS